MVVAVLYFVTLVLLPGPPGRDDADLVERVRPAAGLAAADLHLGHVRPAVPCNSGPR